MKCPKCKSEDVNISFEQVGAKTKKTSIGLGGHINNTARALTAVSTLGMSNLIWKKSTGESKTKMKNAKVCLCQNCGYSWEIK